MNLLEADQAPANDLRAELEAKWADKPVEEVRKAKVDSDLYIKTLEARFDDLRKDYLGAQEQLSAKAGLQSLVDQLQNKTTNSDTLNAKEVVSESSRFDPKEIESLISSSIAKERQNEKEAQNYNSIKNKLIEKYGNNYQSYLNESMNELGMSADDLNEMARKRPNVLTKALGLDSQEKETFQTPPRSNQRNDSFAPKRTKRDWNYYQELKKTNPTLYLDSKIAVQMHNDAIEQGDAFYG